MTGAGPGRPLRHGLLLAGGVAGLLAPPLARHLRRRLRGASPGAAGDPVAPFCAAPCYHRPPEAASHTADTRTRTAP